MKKNEIIELILNNYTLYPLMETIDYFKLLYQNEFGAHHLEVTYDKCYNYIKQEVIKNSSNENYQNELKIIDIGNGYLRFPLMVIKNDEEKISIITDAFYKTTKISEGNLNNFKIKINYLTELVNKQIIPLNIKKYQETLNEYEQLNYPAVSHSDIYRNNYYPSYRVIKKSIIESRLKEWNIETKEMIN